MPVLEAPEPPIISPNIAKFKPASSSWSWDTQISDFGNDDDFKTYWESNIHVKEPWYAVDLVTEQPFNLIVLTVPRKGIREYRLQYFAEGTWKDLPSAPKDKLVKIHRFDRVWGSRVKVLFPGQRHPACDFRVGGLQRKALTPHPISSRTTAGQQVSGLPV